jgi:hypothetical protein
MHLIAEADDRRAWRFDIPEGVLTRGIQALAIRLARAVNRAQARTGRVFGDRYHTRQLKTPLAVRRAPLYVLRNDRKHLAERGSSLLPWHFDPCSSAAEFDGWQPSELLELARRDLHGRRAPVAPSTTAPRSHLLRVGWARHGLLGVEEIPSSR